MDDDLEWEALALAVAPSEAEEEPEAPDTAPGGKREGWAGWTAPLPAPQHRTQEQKCLAAARMREARAAYRLHAQRLRIIGEVNGVLASFREAGLLLDEKLRLAQDRYGGIVIQRGSGRKRIPPETMLAIAFAPFARRNDAARAQAVAPQTVTRIRTIVAACMSRCEAAFMRGLAAGFASHPPRVFIVSMACDSTKQKLSLNLHRGFLQNQTTRSSWNCLVSRQRFAWTLLAIARWFQSEFVRPNVPLLGDAGENLLDGLYGLPVVAPFLDFENSGLRQADISIAHYDLDGHAANIRMVAGRRADLPQTTLVSVRHCGNHANNLVEGCTIDSASSSLLSWMYSASLFLGMGGNFLRLIHSTVEVVRRFMDPPQRADRISEVDPVAAEIMDYSIRNYRAYAEAYEPETWSSDEEDDNRECSDRREHKKRHEQFAQAWNAFLGFFNGPVWRVGGRLGPHHCSSPECCSNYDPHVSRDKAVKVIVNLLYRVMPGVPTKSKWTKLGPCLDWHMLAQGLQGILGLAVPVAFGKMALQVVARDTTQEPD